MSILKNYTDGIHPWQQPLLNKVTQGGFKHGELMLISSGRQTGKSMLNQWFNNNLCKEILMPTEPASKYKFSRAKWHSAQFAQGGLWRLSEEYIRIIEWCTEQFGPHPSEHDAWSRWWVGLGEINFRDESDFIVYTLRWT